MQKIKPFFSFIWQNYYLYNQGKWKNNNIEYETWIQYVGKKDAEVFKKHIQLGKDVS